MAIFPSKLEKRDNTGMLERGWGMFCTEKKNAVTINQFRTTSLLQVEVKIHASVCKGNLRVHGWKQTYRYIYTKGRHTRVLSMHRTHKWHKPDHQGGQRRLQELCSNVVWPSQRFWISAPQADWVSDGVVPYTREGSGDCQELLRGGEDRGHCRWLHLILLRSREGDSHIVYNLSYPVCYGYVDGDQSCWKINKRAKDGIRNISATDQKLNGWFYSVNNNPYTCKIDLISMGR